MWPPSSRDRAILQWRVITSALIGNPPVALVVNVVSSVAFVSRFFFDDDVAEGWPGIFWFEMFASFRSCFASFLLESVWRREVAAGIQASKLC